MHIRRIRHALVATMAASLLLGCGARPDITFIPDGTSYTSDSVVALARTVDMGEAPKLDAEDAPQARADVLASLRSRNADASAFADLMTRTFASGTRSVPVYAEAATVDGRAAWVVVEAWGGSSGPLDKRRVWVLARDSGAVISSATTD